MARPNDVVALALLATVSFCALGPATARIFPNISSVPPWLMPNGSAPGGAWDAFHRLRGCRFGQKADGLGKLKNYFNHFGYFDKSDFSDDFDDALESAIKTYQRNFNLNVTGELDEPTLQRISMPRCGNADVVNGTSTMNSGKAGSHNASAHTHFHTVGHFSFFPGRPMWPVWRRDLTYAFAPENQLSAEVQAVFTRAFARWASVTTLTFTLSQDFASADMTIGFFVGDHGDGEPFDGVLGTLAHAFSPPSGRFHLDGEENWVIGGDITATSITSAIDLESVAVHEIGHLLGLGHSSVENSIMFPTITSRTRKVDLASDDIQGIQTLYGENPNYVTPPPSTPSSYVPSPTTHQSDTSGSGRREIGVIWAVGLALLVL